MPRGLPRSWRVWVPSAARRGDRFQWRFPPSTPLPGGAYIVSAGCTGIRQKALLMSILANGVPGPRATIRSIVSSIVMYDMEQRSLGIPSLMLLPFGWDRSTISRHLLVWCPFGMTPNLLTCAPGLLTSDRDPWLGVPPFRPASTCQPLQGLVRPIACCAWPVWGWSPAYWSPVWSHVTDLIAGNVPNLCGGGPATVVAKQSQWGG